MQHQLEEIRKKWENYRTISAMLPTIKLAIYQNTQPLEVFIRYILETISPAYGIEAEVVEKSLQDFGDKINSMAYDSLKIGFEYHLHSDSSELSYSLDQGISENTDLLAFACQSLQTDGQRLISSLKNKKRLAKKNPKINTTNWEKLIQHCQQECFKFGMSLHQSNQ